MRNLLKTLRYANPALLTRMFSRSPRYSTWCLTLQTDGVAPFIKKGSLYVSVCVCVCVCVCVFACFDSDGAKPALLPVFRSFCLIGLDAADIVRGALHQGVHQVVGLSLLVDIKCEIRAVASATTEGPRSLSGLALTLILELAVVGLLFLSVLRFSGNKLQMKQLGRQIKKKRKDSRGDRFHGALR